MNGEIGGYWAASPDMTYYFWEPKVLKIGNLSCRISCDRNGSGLLYEYQTCDGWVLVDTISVNAARVIIAAAQQPAEVGSVEAAETPHQPLNAPSPQPIEDGGGHVV